MAIIKHAKNMIIKTANKETLICKGKLTEVTTVKWLEATEGKLIMNSIKKIISNGNRE